jgi:hypothetical protein
MFTAGCKSLGIGWPEEGEIVEQAFDVPRVGRYWVIGTVKEVEINYDYIYWFKIRSKNDNLTWVQVDPQTWKAYEVGDHWIKSPEAKVFRYVPVSDMERHQKPDPNRTIRNPTRLPRQSR